MNAHFRTLLTHCVVCSGTSEIRLGLWRHCHTFSQRGCTLLSAPSPLPTTYDGFYCPTSSPVFGVASLVFLLSVYLIAVIYLFLAVLGLHCCSGFSLAAEYGLLIALGLLLQNTGFSSCSM